MAFGALICFLVTEGSCSFIDLWEGGEIFSFFFIFFIFINLRRRACPWGGREERVFLGSDMKEVFGSLWSGE